MFVHVVCILLYVACNVLLELQYASVFVAKATLVWYNEAASIHLHNAMTGVQLLSSLCVAGASACCYELYLQSDWSRVCCATVRMQITVGVQLRK